MRHLNYGSGVYRRSVLLRRLEPDIVDAALEDDFHCFSLRLRHDRQRVTAIESRATRFPLNICSDATGPLAGVVGAPLSASVLALKNHIDHINNCTHLFDLASLSIVHATRLQEPERRYDLTIPDFVGGCTTGLLACNGREVLALRVEQGTITAPGDYAGHHIYRGFARWAVKALDGETLEAALVLQRGFLVSGARRHDMAGRGVMKAMDTDMPRGVCHSTIPPVFETALTRPDTSRDFTDTPEQLLRWMS